MSRWSALWMAGLLAAPAVAAPPPYLEKAPRAKATAHRVGVRAPLGHGRVRERAFGRGADTSPGSEGRARRDSGPAASRALANARGSDQPRVSAPARGSVPAQVSRTLKGPLLTALEVWPESVELSGNAPERQLVVTGVFSDGQKRDLTDSVRYASTMPERVTVTRDGRVTASGDGLATIRVALGGVSGFARVTAQRVRPEERVRFRSEVEAVLSRAGCNQGACHAAQAGKGGFRLSLLGYDPDADYQAIVQDARKRRTLRAEPGESLLLRKPSLAVPHAGGRRFTPDSYEYHLLAEWLANGAPAPKADEPAVAGLEVYPPQRTLRLPSEDRREVTVLVPPAPGEGSGPRPLHLRPVQRIAVLARLKDGTVEDVTRKAQYKSLNDGLAAVDGAGRIEVAGRGQADVMIRYLGAAAAVRMVVPYRDLAPAPALTGASEIDARVAKKWTELGLTPSGPCTDAEFIRRVYLDVLGTLPTPDEVRGFLADCAAEGGGGGAAVVANGGMGERGNGGGPPLGGGDVLSKPNGGVGERGNGGKGTASGAGAPILPLSLSPIRSQKTRARLVDRVLERPEYADYWTLKWGDLLRSHRDKLGEKGMWSLRNWLRDGFRTNKPMDRLARELVTAQGSTFTNGPANYFRVATNPAELAETTSQVFLGVRLACAKCHHHPFEKWTQDDYWQMAAFFSRVALKGSDEFGIYGGEQVVRLNASGEVRNPRTGKKMPPTPLDGALMEDPVDPRRALAAWMTAPENPFFARNLVNRYWSYLMGRGIVEPVDDLRVTNPPSNPELLDWLAQDFAAHGFDVKRLLRQILNGQAYQLSANPTKENRQDEVFFSKYAVKRMGAEELLDAVAFATGAPEKFPNLPAGMRAVQLPDPGVQSYFLQVFGRPERQSACECERSVEPNMAQALHLMNSDFVQNKIAAPGGRLAKLLEAKKSAEEIVEELYLATFSRPPTAAEATRAKELVGKAPSKKEGFEDLLWALLNSREFLFKH